MKRVSKDIEKLIIKEYLSGVATKELSVKYEFNATSIIKVLHRNNISLIKRTFSPTENTKNIIELHKQGLTVQEISDKLKIGRCNIIDRLSYYKIKSNKFYYRNKRTVNDNYFNVIDTQNKAYFLGLLFADGSVGKLKNNISISLIEEDGYLIEKFKKEIESDAPLGYLSFEGKNNWSNQIGIQFYSKQIKLDLIKYGCIPKKSLVVKFPEIDSVYLWHFIRGYFDGNGCAHQLKNRNNQVQVSISSSIFFNYSLKAVLEKFNIKSVFRRSKKISTLVISAKDSVNKFSYLLYENSEIFMIRKKQKFGI